MPFPLTGVVITLNEADRIERCVESMRSLCQDVIVLDSGSTDATVEVARAAGAIVEHQDWLGFSAQKNAAIARAATDWVLLLDADEWLPPDSARQIGQLCDSGRVAAATVWRLQRQTVFLGRQLRFGGRHSEPVERLFRNHLRYAPAAVHESLDLGDAVVARLDAVLLHDTARSEVEYRRKLDGYAHLYAQQRHRAGRRAGAWRAPVHAAFYWLKYCVLRGGFLDGATGRLYHRCHARYVYDKYRYLAALGRQV
jgi:(heptosyl)LPS beta-1,4-glucosyltransferase